MFFTLKSREERIDDCTERGSGEVSELEIKLGKLKIEKYLKSEVAVRHEMP